MMEKRMIILKKDLVGLFAGVKHTPPPTFTKRIVKCLFLLEGDSEFMNSGFCRGDHFFEKWKLGIRKRNKPECRYDM